MDLGYEFWAFVGAILLAVLLCRPLYRVVRRNAKPKGEWMAHNLETGERKRVVELEDGKLFRQIVIDEVCPDCGNKGTFLGGPRGGISQNIFCPNIECRAGFNAAAFSSTEGTCERIHQGDAEAYPTSPEKAAYLARIAAAKVAGLPGKGPR